MGDDPLDRLRAICLALPEAVERGGVAEHTFRVRDKIFAMFLDNHHVSAAGQALFSRKLTREVLVPAWQAWRDPGDHRHALSP